MATIPDALTEDELYPSTDGQPMGETGWHVLAIMTLYQTLRDHFAARPGVYVAADMFLYYEEGQPSRVKAPDCMVVFGVGNHERRSFKTWVEGAAPAVVFEISSAETYREDIGPKQDVYARLGELEYFLFDPLAERLDPPFLGFRLVDGRYEPLPRDADGGLASAVLGLRFVPEGMILRAIDPRTDEPFPTFIEMWAIVDFERLRADEERLRADAERRTARAALDIAKERTADAEAQRRRADELAAELERLRNELKNRGVEGA
jgi:Uma2 family endonuclease